jgi:protein-tyrosine phosphatase
MLSYVTSYINDTYGSKRGLLEKQKHDLLYRLGRFRRLRDVDFSRVRKIVFVCSGNLCRSPFAEFYARHLGLDADSYGLHCRGGDDVDPRVREIGDQKGIEVPDHLTRNIRDYLPSGDDLLVAMEPIHLERLPASVMSTAQVTLLGLWCREPCAYLHDPYLSTPVYFDKCATDIMSALDNIKERVHGQD